MFEVLAAFGRRSDVSVTAATPAGNATLVRDLLGATLTDLVTAPRRDQLALAFWDRHRSGIHFARAGVDVVVGCKHLVPRMTRPTVLVVHDVLTITRARENALVKRLVLPSQYRRSLRDATRLVAVSAATRDRLGAIDTAWAAKCDVVPNGVSLHLLEADAHPPAGVADRPFALAVGDLSPRKNLRLLTRLWREDPPAGLLLVVVGPDAGGDDVARRDLLELERAGRARWVRGADDDVLRWCYEQARAVVLPTREEGFGLPLLEAMSFHAPVVASTDAALVEVADGAPGVTHVPPDDATGWRAAITAVAVVSPRPAPAVPAGALSWDEHTERLLAVARRAAGRDTPAP